MSQPTRRDFLTTSSLAVGAGVLAGAAGHARAFADGDDTIKVGLIGCGGRGSSAAGQALSTKGKVKLIAMADAFGDNLEKKRVGLARQHGAKVDVPKEYRFVGFDAGQVPREISQVLSERRTNQVTLMMSHASFVRCTPMCSVAQAAVPMPKKRSSSK